jgi:putative transposase
MTANQALYPIEMMARVLGVSRSGFYAWRDREPSTRARADAVLTEKIGAFLGRSKLTY